MRKRKQIKWVRSLLCLLMCFILMGGSIPVKAAETVEATVSIPLPSGDRTTRGAYLLAGYNGLKHHSGGLLGIGAYTTSPGPRESLYVGVTLERLENGVWGPIRSWSARSANGIPAIVDTSIVVPTGYSYRLRSTHAVTHGGVTESAIVVGGPLMIY